jgi:hypothetical protein
VIENRAHTSVFRRRLSDTQSVCHRTVMPVAPVGTDATDSVRCRPRTTRGGEPAVVRTAMTWNPTGPHWPGHSPTRETNESSPGVSPVPSECGLEPKDCNSPNPMVGFPRLQAREEVNASHLFDFYASGLYCATIFFLPLVYLATVPHGRGTHPLTLRVNPVRPILEYWSMGDFLSLFGSVVP